MAASWSSGMDGDFRRLMILIPLTELAWLSFEETI